MARAAAVVIKNESVALIKRLRNGRLYYIYPGGQIERSETFEEATIREIKEELGLGVEVKQLLAEITYRDSIQYYFLVKIMSGEFGTGDGPEMKGLYPEELGTYTPVWMKISDLLKNPVYPECVSEIIINSRKVGWPEGVIRCNDQGH